VAVYSPRLKMNIAMQWCRSQHGAGYAARYRGAVGASAIVSAMPFIKRR